ncbi:MAG: TIGR03013 family XrtA/PEP-CTERM system glycosyltransferase [Vicinamibacterales bacterium]
MPPFTRHISRRRITVFSVETVLISMTVFGASVAHGQLDQAVDGAWQIAIITAVCALSFYWNELYDLTVVDTPSEVVIRVMQASGVAAIAIALGSALVPSLLIADGVLLTSLLFLLVVVPAWRLVAQSVAHDHRLEERVLVVGTGVTARMVAAQMEAQRDFPYHCVGYTAEMAADPGAAAPDRTLGSNADLAQIIATHRIDRIVVSMTDRRGTLPLKELLAAKLAGVVVEDAATMYERLTGKLLLDDIKPSWLIFSDGFHVSRTTRVVKRLLDTICAGVGLILASPLALLTMLAIRLDSTGDVLYRQERVGRGGRIFTLYKFRSMRADAEHGVPVWARENDDRVTRIGRLIRKARLDEIPQLWNVLRGDMSLVGPRPERPFFVSQLAEQIPFYMERHCVRPGVTGWAQVRYHYGASIDDAVEKLRYDLYYIKHQSVTFDLAIALDTIKVILVGKGAQ